MYAYVFSDRGNLLENQREKKLAYCDLGLPCEQTQVFSNTFESRTEHWEYMKHGW